MSVDVVTQEKKAENLLYTAVLYLADSEEEFLRREHRAFFQRTALRLKFGGKLTEAEARKMWRTLRFYDSALDKAGIPFRSIPEPPCSTQAVRLIEIVQDNSILFHDEARTAYAVVNVQDHQECMMIRSRELRLWLQGKFLADRGQPPSSQALTDALQAVEGICIHQRPQFPVFVRLAAWKGNIYLDLANTAWEVVEVSPDGWQVTTASPVLFRRPRGMLPLPRPERGGSINELRPFLNARDGDEDSWILRISGILSMFQPRGPYPVLNLTGEQGTGKSTEARVYKALIDPSLAPICSLPRSSRDLAITASNSHALAFDNVSTIPSWLSDAFCQLSTGGGFRVRELYSDSEEAIFHYTKPLILNGIGDFISRPDLLDRTLIIELPVIREEDRRPEGEFWAEFEKVWPRILGALLDAVAKGLRNIDSVKLDRLPRMADFAKWIVACESALPWEPSAFMKAYAGNRAEAVNLTLESDCVAMAIKEFLEHQDSFEGTATKLLGELEEHVSEKVRKSKAWPQNARAFGNRLTRIAPLMRQTGIEIERDRKSKKRLVRIERKTLVTNVTLSQEGVHTQLEGISKHDNRHDKVDAKHAPLSQTLSHRMSSVKAVYDESDKDDKRKHSLSDKRSRVDEVI